MNINSQKKKKKLSKSDQILADKIVFKPHSMTEI